MLRLLLPLLLGLVASVGCDTECEPLVGSYLVEFDERDGGTCGEITDTLVIVSPDDEVAPGCSFSQTTSGDQCTLETEAVCEDASTASTSTVTRVLTSAPDGATAEGIASLRVADTSTGDTICVSTYDIRAERQ
jgi:hypothetical protein